MTIFSENPLPSGSEDEDLYGPPEPLDPKGIRPDLNLDHLQKQVQGVQTFLAQEREKKKNSITK